MTDTTVGYIYHTGAGSADKTQFQQLVTIDAPRRGDVVASCIGRQGPYFLTQEFKFGRYKYYVHVLPTPGGTTDVDYNKASKQQYTWKSKRFVMPGRTTFSSAKVVMAGGCVRLRIYVDSCCRYDAVVQNCAPFKLPDQLVGIDWELELIGTAVVTEVHIASSMQELTREQ
jgi:hypothetical protein